MISLRAIDTNSVAVGWDEKNETEIKIEWNGADGWKVYKNDELLSEFHIL